jgi:putative acetyltransferase
MINCIKTDAGNQHYINLVKQLDADLSARNNQGVNDFHTQFNKTNAIKHVVIAYDDELPVGCGAIKIYDEHTMEVKRMFVLPTKQGKGIATIILKALETWAAHLGFTKCILQTGVNQPEAIRLYQKNNYILIENFGQYAGDLHSVCFEKKLN